MLLMLHVLNTLSSFGADFQQLYCLIPVYAAVGSKLRTTENKLSDSNFVQLVDKCEAKLNFSKKIK